MVFWKLLLESSFWHQEYYQGVKTCIFVMDMLKGILYNENQRQKVPWIKASNPCELTECLAQTDVVAYNVSAVAYDNADGYLSVDGIDDGINDGTDTGTEHTVYSTCAHHSLLPMLYQCYFCASVVVIESNVYHSHLSEPVSWDTARNCA